MNRRAVRSVIPNSASIQSKKPVAEPLLHRDQLLADRDDVLGCALHPDLDPLGSGAALDFDIGRERGVGEGRSGVFDDAEGGLGVHAATTTAGPKPAKRGPGGL